MYTMHTGQGCLSDVGGNYDFPPAVCSRLEYLCLEVCGHLRVYRQYSEGGWIVQLRETLYTGISRRHS